jgi:hypothetical protein
MTALTGRRRPRLALLLALTGCGAVPLAVMAAGGSASHPSSQTLRVSLVPATEQLVDNPPRSKARRGERDISAGDAVVVTEQALDESGRRVGTAHVHCVATRGSRNPDRATAQCAATLRLRDGDIMGAFVFRGEEPRTVAVTGGTGAYEGARGSITFAEQKIGRRTLDQARIHLLP